MIFYGYKTNLKDMIQKLAKLGKIIPEDMFPDNPLGLNRDYEVDDIVFLEFQSTEDQWKFDALTIEKYSKSYVNKYLMKSAKGRKTSEFPTIDVYSIKGLKHEDKIDLVNSKYGNKLTYILAKYSPLFDQIIKEIENNPEVANQIRDRLLDLRRFALSIKLNGSYIGEYPDFNKIIEKLKDRAGKKDYYQFGSKKYEEHEKLCSITNKIEPTIWGYVSPYKFYAVKTEIGSVPGGFDAREAWKNFPVSPKGAEYLERADKFIQEYLNFRFCGYSYFLIPERILGSGNDEEFLEYIKDFKKFCLSREGNSNNRLAEDLIKLLKEKKENSASYTLFFYEKNNSEFKILASIEDVFPSYASKIYEAKTASENHAIFKGLKRKKEIYDLKFTFSHIKEFVPEQAAFLEIVRSIFMQKNIDFGYLLGRIVSKFQTDFANSALYPTTVLKAILILKLLQKLDLIQQTKTTDEVIMDNKYESFFEENNEFFNSDSAIKKAIFLEGVLAQFLLNIQYQERNATPFRSRLNSLKMNEKIIKRLLPEIIEKLEQYGKNYYRDLEQIISKYLLKARFSISDNEISFYFTMGMNLAGEFKSDKKNDNENSNEE